MNQKKKHIALLIAMIFVLPIAIQSWHISHHEEYVHSCCDNSGYNLTEYTHCAVCEYEFVKYAIPELEEIKFSYSEYFEKTYSFKQIFIPRFGGTITSLRAPPQNSLIYS